MLETLWLNHAGKSMCDAFRDRFAGLPSTRVVCARFEDLGPNSSFVTSGVS